MSGMTHGFNEVTPSYLGAMCAQFRRMYTSYTQEQAADEIGCSREVVCKFERGRSCNAIVFLWYIKQGLFEWCPAERWNGWDMGM